MENWNCFFFFKLFEKYCIVFGGFVNPFLYKIEYYWKNRLFFIGENLKIFSYDIYLSIRSSFFLLSLNDIGSLIVRMGEIVKIF